jgi:hypothetical protein
MDSCFSKERLMRYSKWAVALFAVLVVAGNATAQHKGDPALDALARQYEARFQAVEARLDALEGKRAVSAPMASPVVYGQEPVYVQPMNYQSMPMFYSAPMFESQPRRGFFGRRGMRGASVCGPGGCN